MGKLKMKLVFLGSASCYPTPVRGVSCTALQLDDGAVWIFDCGEGSQIQIQKSSIKPGKITKIFITHLHGDHMFGLQGLLCTMGNGQDPEKAKNTTIHLYGPLGLRKYLTTCLALSRSPLIFNITVHEIIPRSDQYPEDWETWPVQHELSDSPLPQEKLCSRVEYDDKVKCWNLFSEKGLTVSAAALKHRIPSFGFIIKEKDSPGRLNTEKLSELGISAGPIYGKLKAGQVVTLDSGQVLQPKDYLGAPVGGRRIAICGDTCDSNELVTAAQSLDLLVHEATMEDSLLDKCVSFGHSTPSMAADVAYKLNAQHLILSHVSPRYRPISLCDESNVDDSAQMLLNEAKKHLCDIEDCKTNVMIAEDFFEFLLPKKK